MVNMDTILLAVRGFQIFLSVCILGLMAYVATWWQSHWRMMSPTEVNFSLFASSLTIVAAVFLAIAPLKLPRLLAHPVGRLGLVALELLTMLCWFAGFVSLAVFLRDRICFGAVCDVAKAGTGLSALSWLLWCGTAVVGVIQGVKGVRRGNERGAQAKVEMHQGV